MATEKQEHLLVILPHPDDEAFGASGTMAGYIERGVPVTYACATLGEMGRNMGHPFFANRETLPEVRKKELKDACKAIGIQDLRMLGLRDKTLEFENEEQLAKMMLDLIEDVNPSRIITFYPGYAIHPDHNALGHAVVKAVAKMDENNRPELYCKAITTDADVVLGAPELVNDVREVIEQKVASIKAHRSQAEVMLAAYDTEDPENDPALVQWLGIETFWYFNDKLDQYK